VDEEVRCGRYEVYENRAAGNGRKIGLNIVVLPAKGPEVAADPLVFLAGGGVAPATRYAGFLSEAYANLRRQRDVVLVDQRGTGGSNPLECDVPTDPASADYRDEGRFLAAVRRCWKELEQKDDTDPCVNGIIEAFMIAGKLAGLDTSCLAKTEELSFALHLDELVK
jgi:hypothetical protein